MTEFIVLAALLVAAAILIMAVPLLRRDAAASSAAASGSNRREANLAILRDQLAELENERREGTLSDADFEQAKGELQRRLLEETQAEEAQPATAPSAASAAAGRKSALLVLLALPIAIAAGYAALGEPRALNPQLTQPASKVSEQQMLALVEQLAERLKAKPDDLEGWVTLARSYKTLGRNTEAASAYARGGRMVEESAPLLADYAETLGQIANGSLLGRPQELIAQALKINPDEPQALFLAGAAASEERQFGAAADYWERLLKQMDPNGEETRALADAAAKAREIARHGASATAAPAAGAAAQSNDGSKSKAAAADSSIAGEVKLAPALAARVKPDDVIFVFARAEDGERRPLAALRGNAANLPLRFHLDDAAALPGGRKMSEVATVVVEARIARAGIAQSSSGDLYGRVAGVRPGSSGLQLLIDKIEP
ncbi:c-type cytochrome biogenesis protein CcmI [Rhodocyclus tenuis]|uniref:c-type cytochrome biogenesis protein CcmI n=1 Tax=Rhodocyclus tenuis TaxID=1066 RepID=UPI001906A557|nr:c-type cytochrome biogenesis protein CcmI [Rhodocyclus tenuis]MBK1681679.1 c-type cytochrome biogenesis protein CcmI [Rhodocyclus tenuis]